MNILVIGSGGREHALSWKLKQSARVQKIFCAPGNAGTAALGENVPLSPEDISGLIKFAKSHHIDFSVVGPDDALAAGIVDAFEKNGLKIFGPCAEAARLESSKSFAKNFMRRHGIPTAASHEFTDSLEAHTWCCHAHYPLVIKADGLALGKGVTIARTPEEAARAIYHCMDAKIFGSAGRRILIEEFLSGVECSVHALVDGHSYLLFPDCRDHKRAFDDDQGPNTGGMGTICPSGSLDETLREQIKTEVLDRFLEGIRKDGIPFRGMLFPGVMLTSKGPKVLEFNCRWGDPETQVLVRRLNSDLLDLLEACTDGTLARQKPTWSPLSATCVILASGGYPGSYEKGKEIQGLQAAAKHPSVEVFHAGTRALDGKILTNGGRVLGVTALGATPKDSRNEAYRAVTEISFDQMQYRSDIGLSSNKL